MGCSGIPKTKDNNIKDVSLNKLKFNEENNSINTVKKIDIDKEKIKETSKECDLFSLMEEFNKNFKDNQGLILNKYKRSNFCITNDSNIIANSQISFENLHSKYYFNFNKGLDIFANDINDDSNYINFKNEIKYLKNDENI